MFKQQNIMQKNKFKSYIHSNNKEYYIFCCHLHCLKMLNDDKVSLVRFLNDKVCATRINQEKNLELYFQVPIKYAIYLLDYIDTTFDRSAKAALNGLQFFFYMCLC